METADIGTPDASGRFQVMPPLTDEEYAALREDIRRDGVLVPIEADADGGSWSRAPPAGACEESAQATRGVLS